MLTSGYTLMTKLMECTHGQWLYRNIMVHDTWNGTINRLRKEDLLKEIESQLEMEDELLPEDQYLMEVNEVEGISIFGRIFSFFVNFLSDRSKRSCTVSCCCCSPLSF